MGRRSQFTLWAQCPCARGSAAAAPWTRQGRPGIAYSAVSLSWERGRPRYGWRILREAAFARTRGPAPAAAAARQDAAPPHHEWWACLPGKPPKGGWGSAAGFALAGPFTVLAPGQTGPRVPTQWVGRGVWPDGRSSTSTSTSTSNGSGIRQRYRPRPPFQGWGRRWPRTEWPSGHEGIGGTRGEPSSLFCEAGPVVNRALVAHFS
jgi:hypothetical protein